MFGGLTIQAVFLVVIGAALLVTGTSGLRRSIRMKKQKAQRTGKILRISHVEKRDEEGFLIQNRICGKWSPSAGHCQECG